METTLFTVRTLRNSTVLLFVTPDTRDKSAQNCVGVIVRNIKYLENNEAKLHYLHLEGLKTQRKRTGNSKLVTSWHRNCNTKQFGDNNAQTV